jgi:hypothetical protein
MPRRHARLRHVHDRLGGLELGPARVERGRVAVRADAEQDEVELVGQLDIGRAQGMDLALGNGHAVEERLAREALVRVGMIGRNEPLVAPPNVPVLPVERQRRESPVDGWSGRSARERDPKSPTRPIRDEGCGELA